MEYVQINLWSTIILFATLGIASWQDYRTQAVPRLLTWAMIFIGLFLPSPWGDFWWRLIGTAITIILVTALLLFFPEGLGGSDARVLVAFGAYFGRAFPVFIILVGLCQPIFLLVLYYRRKRRATQRDLEDGYSVEVLKEDGEPFLPFLLIVAAVCVGLLQ